MTSKFLNLAGNHYHSEIRHKKLHRFQSSNLRKLFGASKQAKSVILFNFASKNLQKSRLGGVLGRLGSALGRLGDILGRLGRIMEASWKRLGVVLGLQARKDRGRKPKLEPSMASSRGGGWCPPQCPGPWDSVYNFVDKGTYNFNRYSA